MKGLGELEWLICLVPEEWWLADHIQVRSHTISQEAQRTHTCPTLILSPSPQRTKLLVQGLRNVPLLYRRDTKLEENETFFHRDSGCFRNQRYIFELVSLISTAQCTFPLHVTPLFVSKHYVPGPLPRLNETMELITERQ